VRLSPSFPYILAPHIDQRFQNVSDIDYAEENRAELSPLANDVEEEGTRSRQVLWQGVGKAQKAGLFKNLNNILLYFRQRARARAHALAHRAINSADRLRG